MKRISIKPRDNWQAEVEKWGMIYHTHEGELYWDESAYYEFDAQDVEALETSSQELHNLCLEAVDRIIKKKDFDRFHIPLQARAAITRSWNSKQDGIYARMDLAYDGESSPKFLEYNADTPTTLLEAAVVQWQWSQDVFPGSDQFNSIWEALTHQWQQLRQRGKWQNWVHFSHGESVEDLMTVSLLRDSAEEIGIITKGMHMEDIGWADKEKLFIDLDDEVMTTIFKLYPWEWMIDEPFGLCALETLDKVEWLEPIWKMLLSNKMILPVLWEMFPGHQNLLPAFFGEAKGMSSYVRKPVFSREGSNVQVVKNGIVIEETMGSYGSEGMIYQGLADIPDFDGNKPVFGSWIVGHEPCGIGIRECNGWITTDLSRFVPNIIKC